MNKKQPKDEDILTIAKKGGNDSTLFLLEKISELEDKLDSVSSEQSPDNRAEKLATKLASKFLTMEKGDKGDIGDEPSNERLTDLITPLIPKPIKGENGKDYVLTEKDKKEIADSIKVPVVEKVIEKIEVIKEQDIIKQGKDGKDGSPDTPDQVIKKVNTSKQLIKKDKVEGLLDIERIAIANSAVPVTTSFFNGLRAKNLSIMGTGNASVTAIQNGDTVIINISASGGGGSGYQLPSGNVNGSNQVFVYSTTPNAIVVDGVVIQQTNQDGTVNWTGTTTVTLSIAPNFSTFAIA